MRTDVIGQYAAFFSHSPPKSVPKVPILSAEKIRQLCLECGADDVGFVEINRPELDDQRDDILKMFPWTKTLISLTGRLNRENLRSPARSIASLELHKVGEGLTDASHKLAAYLERMGVRAVSPAAGFPMEMDRWLGKMYIVSHKPVAVAAGLGHMGLHRNVIHPVFGSHILLNTLLIEAELDGYGTPLDYNPCFGCKLCAAACPTGAIGPDGFYNPINCLTHTYRELVGGFANWVENIADSKNSRDYRTRISDAETVSMWQSLANGSCYKSVYCMAVCPAGDDVIPQYLEDKKKFIEDVAKPLQQKEETVYVLPGSDAESHVLRSFPHKKIKRVGNGVRPPSIKSFLGSIPRAFQRHKSEGLNATYHFTFTGEESESATVIISNKTVTVKKGHEGAADVRITADSRAWLKVLHKDSAMLKEIVFGKIRVKGPVKLFKAFGACFV
ncbi:MAG: SCP2 sterol-binding domain-containing protein [Nitrospirae bacterium]|nr:SCP2 sterol-binding domain-containing protein [Nitrospirota bacterium]